MLFPEWVFNCNMVSNIIKDYFHIMIMCKLNKFLNQVHISKPLFYFSGANRPVAMISGIISMGFRIFLICLIRIIHNRREPNHIYAERIKIALIYFVNYSLKVTSLIICLF